MKSIDEHIQKDQSEIEAAKAAGDEAKVRHLTDELKSLEEYKEHHPGDSHDPTRSSCIARPIPMPRSAASTTTEPTSG
ncbi:MAG: hypothetical protein CM15mP116_03970 [Synechococcus sp.]|nr:MAG: hypothetical protein CM15mP116_03970 [Synechococcus sp.]